MRKQMMPQARLMDRPKALQWDIAPQALERWTPSLVHAAAAAEESANSISILDPIGVDFWTGEGVTAKRIDAALRRIGAENDVIVNLNSPGGDFFEGLAIYNRLREHRAQVKVKILGLAISAASVIAMAGDEIEIARAGFFMVHNTTWVATMGNRHDLREAADFLEEFDLVSAELYAARTGLELKAVQKKMDAETWINGSAAVDEGWADALLPADEIREEKKTQGERAAAYLVDMALAKAGMPRSERRSLLQDYRASTRNAAAPAGTPRATEGGTPGAAVFHDYMQALKETQL